jgi:hypothetical protein
VTAQTRAGNNWRISRADSFRPDIVLRVVSIIREAGPPDVPCAML